MVERGVPLFLATPLSKRDEHGINLPRASLACEPGSSGSQVEGSVPNLGLHVALVL